MFAVIEDGSRQYRVQEGDVIRVDYREGDKGHRVEFPRVLLYSNNDDLRVGQPLVEGMRVLGEVVEQTSVKLYIQKFRRRKNYKRLKGHRQPYTRVQVRYILLPGMEPPPPPAPAPTEPPAGATPPGPPEGQAPASPPAETPPAGAAPAPPEGQVSAPPPEGQAAAAPPAPPEGQPSAPPPEGAQGGPPPGP